MKTRIFGAVLFASLVACAGPTVEAQGDFPGPQVQPPSPPPATPPPPPTFSGGWNQAPPSVGDGQWVYTAQYGWVWMPYGDQFVWVPSNGTGEPLAFIYYPAYGWTWAAAPWVWGVGPWPSFGRARPDRFAWYQHGWWRTPRRWHYSGAPPRGQLATRGVRPAPPGRPAPIARPAPTPSEPRQGRAEPQRRPSRAEPQRAAPAPAPAPRAEPGHARERGDGRDRAAPERREGERERRPE